MSQATAPASGALPVNQSIPHAGSEQRRSGAAAELAHSHKLSTARRRLGASGAAFPRQGLPYSRAPRTRAIAVTSFLIPLSDREAARLRGIARRHIVILRPRLTCRLIKKELRPASFEFLSTRRVSAKNRHWRLSGRDHISQRRRPNSTRPQPASPCPETHALARGLQ